MKNDTLTLLLDIPSLIPFHTFIWYPFSELAMKEKDIYLIVIWICYIFHLRVDISW